MDKERQIDLILATLRETLLNAKAWNMSAARPMTLSGNEPDDQGRGAITPGPSETWLFSIEHEV